MCVLSAQNIGFLNPLKTSEEGGINTGLFPPLKIIPFQTSLKPEVFFTHWFFQINFIQNATSVNHQLAWVLPAVKKVERQQLIDPLPNFKQ